jgi:hypothetical protein
MSFVPTEIKKQEKIDEKRRTFLTVGITAIVAFVVSRFIDSSQLFRKEKVLREASFENFDMVETTNEIRLSARDGEPIFIVDKASFRE